MSASRHVPPRTAIIVGTHNYAAILRQCLDSVLAQTDPSWECIVVDNGSTDGTPVVAEFLVARDARFRLVQCANRGPSAGRNAGYARISASVEYVHFLDGDDVLEPGFIEHLREYLDRHVSVGAVGCNYVEIDSHGGHLRHHVRSRWAPRWLGFPGRIPSSQPATPFETFFAVTGNGPFFLFRRSVLARTDLYDESLWFCEDSDILCRVALLASVHFMPEFLYRKRTHSENISRRTPAGREEQFRAKWDDARGHAPHTRARIESAVQYYYRRHVPLRDVKVAMKSLRSFVLTAKPARLVFAGQLLANAVRGLAGRTLPRHP